MALSEVLGKLRYRREVGGVAVNAPPYISATLKVEGFSDGFRVEKSTFTLIFIRDKAELAVLLPETLPRVEPDSLLWVLYPRNGSKIATDLNRDIVWDLAEPLGIKPVAQVAFDSNWSAMRFRLTEKVNAK